MSQEDTEYGRVVLSPKTLVPIGAIVLVIGFTYWIANVASNVARNTEADREILQRYSSIEAQLESVRAEMRLVLGGLASKGEVDLMIRAAVSDANAPIHRQLGEILGRIRSLEDQAAKRGD